MHKVAIVRGPLKAVQHGRRPVQHGVEADHAQRVGSPGDQRASCGVRPVGELADGGEHPVPRERANVGKWRQLMGATDPKKADAGTIRKDFGIDVEQNATHGSDAPETAAQEIAFFFAAREILS